MTAVRQRITLLIQDQISDHSLVHIADVAAKLSGEYPEYTPKQLADLVSEAVIAARGNAVWDDGKLPK